MHGISLLPIAQPGCKLEDTSTETAPTQRQLGVYDGDPTIDLVLPPRPFLAVRPLTDDGMSARRKTKRNTGGAGVDDLHVWWPAQPKNRPVDLLLQRAGGDMGLWKRRQIEAAKQRVCTST